MTDNTETTVDPDSIFTFPAELPAASARTSQEWVDFYLECEAEAATAKQVRFDDGRYMSTEDLNQIVKARMSWERRVIAEKRRNSGRRTLGGFAITKADLSR